MHCSEQKDHICLMDSVQISQFAVFAIIFIQEQFKLIHSIACYVEPLLNPNHHVSELRYVCTFAHSY